MVANNHGKVGSTTLSKEKKLTRPWSTKQNFNGMPLHLLWSFSTSTLEGGLSLQKTEKKNSKLIR